MGVITKKLTKSPTKEQLAQGDIEWSIANDKKRGITYTKGKKGKKGKK